eukprot:6191007-Pleurochrysis_carterae.AAC.3
MSCHAGSGRVYHADNLHARVVREAGGLRDGAYLTPPPCLSLCFALPPSPPTSSFIGHLSASFCALAHVRHTMFSTGKPLHSLLRSSLCAHMPIF